MNLNGKALGHLIAAGLMAGCLLSAGIAHAATEKVLYAFRGGKDGAASQAGLIGDAAGNLYGRTASGGNHYCGTVFKLAQDSSETILHFFLCHGNGARPDAPLVMDTQGNLYGTTQSGGKEEQRVVSGGLRGGI